MYALPPLRRAIVIARSHLLSTLLCAQRRVKTLLDLFNLHLALVEAEHGPFQPGYLPWFPVFPVDQGYPSLRLGCDWWDQGS
jgi:hypothetical protein